jgi:hypothetical protein
MHLLLKGLTRRGAQLPLALASFACALALLAAVVLDSAAVGGPVGLVIALLFALNGAARLWLRDRLPLKEY